jgi:hypothetical protein
VRLGHGWGTECGFCCRCRLLLVGLFVDFRGEGSGLGEVEAFGGEGGGADDADDAFWGAGGAEAGEVHAGELKSVEDGVGAARVELAGSDGVDDDGEGQLDRVAIFEGSEFEVFSVEAGADGAFFAAEGFVAIVEALVEEAEVALVEGGRTALRARGVDVAAEEILHFQLLKGVPPPVNRLVKRAMDATT